ncbi:MAG: HAD-IB family phosphatase [Myxococcota bacterium]|nr:HAD-IB family phosphatase [Myxococcota bacterium]
MSSSRAILFHPQAGHLEGFRLGVRSSSVGPSSWGNPIEYGTDRPLAGTRRIGPLAFELSALDHREAATLEGRVSNVGRDPVAVESVVVGFRWSPPRPAPLRYLKHGWQSWSYTGVRDLDAAGEPAFPSSPWLRSLHHVHAEVPADRSGWHESATVGVVGSAEAGEACLLGALEGGENFSVVYMKPVAGGVEIELEQSVEVWLQPGESRVLEPVRVALGPDASRLLEAYATLWGRRGNARTESPFQSGWCSWYRFFHEVTEEDLLRNLDALSRSRDSLPVDVVQLDDGYQRAIGDWLETNEKFPSGLPSLAKHIRDAGFTPGLWTAPFCVVPESRVAQAHPEWLLRKEEDEDEFLVGTFVPAWTATGSVHALDTTREEVVRHLESVFRELVAMGFEYLKLDFLHSVAARARSADPSVNRSQRLRLGLEAVRHGAGNEAFLLGCGCPMGAAIGIVDGMRIGPDVGPHWEPASPILPGIEATLPSTASAIRSVLLRSWMHRRLWQNDPDCLMTRREATALSSVEAESLSRAIGATGGMVVFSDDVPTLGEPERALLRETLGLSRDVDGREAQGAARIPDLLAHGEPEAIVAGRGAFPVRAVFNLGEEEKNRPGSPSLSPHASFVEEASPPRPLAVFCDFDGTFSVQDVGSTLARIHRVAERPAVQERFARREITAWESNMELLDGLDLPEAELDAFLHTVDLDPGARALLEWCRTSGYRFEILSDGFDTNLDRLQKIHGVEFEYQANRLVYDSGRWKISPGAPDPACSCGTGVCKRAQIETYREAHPGGAIVHVGNGQVSDLCGAIAADLAFAKDTLAPALFARGEPFLAFDTLDEVVAILEGYGFGPPPPENR